MPCFEHYFALRQYSINASASVLWSLGASLCLWLWQSHLADQTEWESSDLLPRSSPDSTRWHLLAWARKCAAQLQSLQWRLLSLHCYPQPPLIHYYPKRVALSLSRDSWWSALGLQMWPCWSWWQTWASSAPGWRHGSSAELIELVC